MTEQRFRIHQVQEGIPIWDLRVGDRDVGSLTDFPNEGPMATVRYGDQKVTIGPGRFYDVVVAARDAYELMVVQYDEHIDRQAEAYPTWH